jgi:hypothetical protein
LTRAVVFLLEGTHRDVAPVLCWLHDLTSEGPHRTPEVAMLKRPFSIEMVEPSHGARRPPSCDAYRLPPGRDAPNQREEAGMLTDEHQAVNAMIDQGTSFAPAP